MTGRLTTLAAVGSLACGPALAEEPPSGAEVRILDVHHDPAVIDPTNGEAATIRFRTTAPAHVEVRIYDGRDLLVRSERLGRLPGGSHEYRWDGRDRSGRPVPPEAYAYSLVASDGSRELAVHDLTDLTGGELLLRGEGPQFRLESGRIVYRLRQNARVSLRIGLEDGPLLETLLHWAPRAAGPNSEAWDGEVANGLLNVLDHPGLDVRIHAFSLPANTILVGPESSGPDVIEDLADAPRRSRNFEPARRMMDHARQSLDERRSFFPRVTWPEAVERAADGSVQVVGPVPLQIDLDPRDRARAHAQRIEVAFYLDGVFLHEVEQAFLPMRWTFDPTGLAGGRHFVTINLLSYEGNFGTTTVAVDVHTPGGGP